MDNLEEILIAVFVGLLIVAVALCGLLLVCALVHDLGAL